MITTSEVAVSVTIDDDTNLKEIEKELLKYGTVEIDREQTIVSVVGEFLEQDKGVASRILECLKGVSIRMISYGGSNHNISFLINTDDKKVALVKLNALFN